MEEDPNERARAQKAFQLWIFRKIVQDALHDFKGGRSGNCGSTSVAMVPKTGAIAQAFSNGERVLADGAGSEVTGHEFWSKWIHELGRKKPSGHALERVYLQAAIESVQSEYPILDSVLTVIKFDVTMGSRPDQANAIIWPRKGNVDRYATTTNLTGTAPVPGMLQSLADRIDPVFTDAWGKGGDAVLNALLNVERSEDRCKNNYSNILDPASSSSDLNTYYETPLPPEVKETARDIIRRGFEVFFGAMLTAFCSPADIDLRVTRCELLTGDQHLGMGFSYMLNGREGIVEMYHNDNNIANICEAINRIDGRSKGQSIEPPGISGLIQMYKTALDVGDEQYLKKNAQLKALIVSYKGFGDWIQWFYVSGLKLKGVIRQNIVVTRTNDKFVAADFAQGGIQPCLLSAVALETFLTGDKHPDSDDNEDDEGSQARVSVIGEALHLPEYHPQSWGPHIAPWIGRDASQTYEQMYEQIIKGPISNLEEGSALDYLQPVTPLQYNGNEVNIAELGNLTFAQVARTLSCLKLAIDKTQSTLVDTEEAVSELSNKVGVYFSMVDKLVAGLTGDQQDPGNAARQVKLVALECGRVAESMDAAAQSFSGICDAFVKLAEQADRYLSPGALALNEIRTARSNFQQKTGEINRLRARLAQVFNEGSPVYEGIDSDLKSDIVTLLNGGMATGPLERVNNRARRHGEAQPVLSSLYGIWKKISSMSLLFGAEGDGEGDGGGEDEMRGGTFGDPRTPHRNYKAGINTNVSHSRREKLTIQRRKNQKHTAIMKRNRDRKPENASASPRAASSSTDTSEYQMPPSDRFQSFSASEGDILGNATQLLRWQPMPQSMPQSTLQGVLQTMSQLVQQAEPADLSENGALGAVLMSSLLTPRVVLRALDHVWPAILGEIDHLFSPSPDFESQGNSSLRTYRSDVSVNQFGGSKPGRSRKKVQDKQQRRSTKSRRRRRRTPKSKTLRFK